jgi:hypothetical protein
MGGYVLYSSDRIQLVEGCCECSNEPLHHQIHGISWHGVKPLSYEGLCSVWLDLPHTGHIYTQNVHTHSFHCSSLPFVLILYPSHKWQILTFG